MDKALAAMFGKSCGINISPFDVYDTSDPNNTIVVEGGKSVWSCINMDELVGLGGNPKIAFMRLVTE